VIRVRQGKSGEPRVLKVTRGLLPRKTVAGIRNRADGTRDVLIRGTDSIGYLKFEEISGSTPHELRALARRLEDDGARALILDLRPAHLAHLHPTVLLADALLDGGTIGRVRTRERVETFRAEPGALFRGWPLAVLVDGNTSGATEWLAAALQDNHRAIVVGVTPGRSHSLPPGEGAGVRTAVPVGDGAWTVEMTTGRFERGDGRPLARSDPASVPRPRPTPRSDRSNGGGEGGGGLTPDVVIAEKTSSQQAPRQRSEVTEVDPNVSGDAILTAALRRLREVLKSPGAEAPVPPPSRTGDPPSP
jgi:carboxyl-terminal processing protease